MKFLERFGGYVFEDWSQIWNSGNWVEIHIISAYVEVDHNLGTIEFDFSLLGLGFHVWYTFDFDTELRRQVEMINDDIR